MAKVKKMVSFIIEMPTEEDSHNWAHKFPFVTSEIFCSEADVVFKHFFNEPPKPVMQVRLKSKLNTPKEINEATEEVAVLEDEKVKFEDENSSSDEEDDKLS